MNIDEQLSVANKEHIRNECRFSQELKITMCPICNNVSVKEKKTKKERNITINNTVYDAVQSLIASLPNAEDGDFLFQSRKGRNALCVPYLNSLVKGWCSEINLIGNYGSHSLRKTFGYIHRTVFNTDIPTLMQMFNHSTQKQTLAYLGIQSSEIKDAYLKEI